jgi:hypothetical protein
MLVDRNKTKPTEEVYSPLEDYDEPLPTSSSRSTPQTLVEWLKSNVDTARARLAMTEPRRLETERIQDNLCIQVPIQFAADNC